MQAVVEKEWRICFAEGLTERVQIGGGESISRRDAQNGVQIHHG